MFNTLITGHPEGAPLHSGASQGKTMFFPQAIWHNVLTLLCLKQ